MAAPTTLYVKDSSADEWRILSGITDWAKCVIPVTAPTYRNTGWTPGTADVASSAGAASVSGMPVGGTSGGVLGTISTNYIATVANITHAKLPDEMAGEPPRQWLRMESATVFAFDVLYPIPSNVALSSISVIDASTNVLTTNGPHNVADGDWIKISSLLPIGGIDFTQWYQVAFATSNTFQLINSNASLVNITNQTFAFTSFDAATDIITAASHGLASGDTVNWISGTIGGVSALTAYTVNVISSSTFQLLSAGVTVNLTGATSAGTFIYTGQTVSLVSPASLLNRPFIFVLDSNNPAFSVGDPR